jgi:hypothetical protein
VDASKNDYPDFGSRTAGRSLAESKTPQEPLETLADETGGRSYLNSNVLDEAVSEALNESSAYYLLAWKPDTESEKAGKSRIEVVIKDRPNLRVRMRRHSFDFKPNQATKTIKPEGAASSTTSPEVELRAALGALYPNGELPVSLAAGYLNTLDKTPLLRINMQIDTERLSFDGPEGKQEAAVDVLGVALDDRGSFSSFSQKLKIPRDAATLKNQRFVTWSQSLPLPPGLYQLRVAVRDSQSGHTGGVIEWIEIPRIEADTFGMSSLFLTERPVQSGAPEQSRATVDHRFARSSVLQFQTYVYNASRPSAPDVSPNVWVEAQVLRGSQQVITVAPSRIPLGDTKDPWRLSYSSEFALGQLPPGSYTLQVTATDKGRGTSASQRITFAVE